MGGMEYVFYLLALACLGVAVYFGKAFLNNPYELWPYKAKAPQTENEWDMYWRLVKALPDHVVMPQVAMSAIVDVKLMVKNRYVWRNRIDRKVLDYVVCNRGGGILAAIELDDKTHLKPERRKADKVKDKVMTDAGIKLIRWESKDKPETAEIRRSVLGEGVSFGNVASVVSRVLKG